MEIFKKDKKIEKTLEQIISETILANKIVWITKYDDVIQSVKIFEDKNELINWCKEQEKDGSWFEYYSAKDAYLRRCNWNYLDYLEDFGEPYYGDSNDLSEIEVANKFKSMTPYDEYVKDVKPEDFKEGLYDGADLIIPFNFPEPSVFETETIILVDSDGNEIDIDDIDDYDEVFEGEKKVKLTIELR